jgi:hypothetical protein
MPYSIFVFNQCALGEISADELESDLKKVSFTTLCKQYGLDPQLIPEAQENLDVLAADSDVSPFFLVSYQPKKEKLITVFRREVRFPEDKALLMEFVQGQQSYSLKSALHQTCCFFRIDLEKSQLRDMGLLLGYEIARWLSFRGKGLVMDLQGMWYRLNVHQAFIPFMEE